MLGTIRRSVCLQWGSREYHVKISNMAAKRFDREQRVVHLATRGHFSVNFGTLIYIPPVVLRS